MTGARLGSPFSQISIGVPRRDWRNHKDVPPAWAPPERRRCRAAAWPLENHNAGRGGLRLDGLTAPMVIDGAMNGEVFTAYAETLLAPTLNPGTSFMDNLPVLCSSRPTRRTSIRSSRSSQSSRRSCEKPPQEPSTHSRPPCDSARCSQMRQLFYKLGLQAVKIVHKNLQFLNITSRCNELIFGYFLISRCHSFWSRYDIELGRQHNRRRYFI